MERETLIAEMAKNKIHEADLSQGPTAMLIYKSNRRPKCIVVRAEGDDFVAEVSGIFFKESVKVTRDEIMSYVEGSN